MTLTVGRADVPHVWTYVIFELYTYMHTLLCRTGTDWAVMMTIMTMKVVIKKEA